MSQTILVVDDDLDTQRFLSVLLGRQGYRVLGAGGGQEALALVERENPDLFVVDVMMPGMDGLALARELRRSPKTAEAPILMFSARTQEEDWRAGFAAGADEYLNKPAKPAEIQRVVGSLMAESSDEEANHRNGFLVGVVGVRSGLGVSTTALNLAAAFARKNKGNVAAVEMQAGASNWRSELNINQSTTLADLFEKRAISTGILDRAFNRTAFGLRVLLAGEQASPVESAKAPALYATLLKKLRRTTDFAVLDLGVPRLPEFPVILEQMDELLVVTSPDDETLSNTAHLIEYLRGMGIGNRCPMMVIVNQVGQAEGPASYYQTGAAEALLLHSIAYELPMANELMLWGKANFRPVYLEQPDAGFSRRFDEIYRRIQAHIEARTSR